MVTGGIKEADEEPVPLAFSIRSISLDPLPARASSDSTRCMCLATVRMTLADRRADYTFVMCRRKCHKVLGTLLPFDESLLVARRRAMKPDSFLPERVHSTLPSSCLLPNPATGTFREVVYLSRAFVFAPKVGAGD